MRNAHWLLRLRRDQAHGRRRVCAFLAVTAVAALWPGSAALAQPCTPTGTNQTCTNSIFLSGGAVGINDTATLTLTNTATGSILGTNTVGVAAGIFAGSAIVTNHGAISGTGGALAPAVGILGVTDVNVTNYGTISATGFLDGRGIQASTVTLTNYGTVSGTGGPTGGAGIGITAATAIVTNYGIIAGIGQAEGGFGIVGSAAGETAIVTNYGTISGTSGTLGTFSGGFGILVDTAIVTNYGTISGTSFRQGGGFFEGGFGIRSQTAIVTNYGTISGTGAASGFGIHSVTGNVTNAGTILGTTAAIELGGGADTLTLLPGSRIIGAINLGGGGDTVNFRGGNHNLTFDTLAGATVTGTTPFVVVGNRAVAIDPSGFALTDRALNDVVGGVSGMIESRWGNHAGGGTPGGGGMVASYAPVRTAPVAGKVPWPVKAKPIEPYDPVTVVWAQGFGGERRQGEDLPLPAADHRFAGGAIGFDQMVSPALRLGAFAGGAWGRLEIDRDGQRTEGDYAFGGVYGRFDWWRTFLDFAMSIGSSRNERERRINNNLVPGGIEVAKGSFDGWFVSPEAKYGVRIPLAGLIAPIAPFRDAALVPAAKLRYLAAWYDGYAESGSTANLTVGERSLQSFEGRLQLALTTESVLPWGGLLRAQGYVGALGYWRVGDDGVDALLLGQGLAFAVPGKDQAAGWYYGSGFDISVGPAVRLFGEAQGIWLNDDSRTITGRGGVKIAF